KCAHGVFLSGAGFSTDSPPLKDATFPVFMTAGMLDFNYRELSSLDSQLAFLGYPHFLRRFDGAHEWALSTVWPEGLSWMNLQAMKDKRLDREDAFVATELQRFATAAKEVEATGNLYYAAQAFKQVAAAFEGLTNIDSLRQHADGLEKNPSYRAAEK